MLVGNDVFQRERSQEVSSVGSTEHQQGLQKLTGQGPQTPLKQLQPDIWNLTFDSERQECRYPTAAVSYIPDTL